MNGRLTLAVLLLAAAVGWHPSARAGDRPHVVIAVLDACRPDKMGCYGFERGTTPAIDDFAANPDSVVFERHYVQGSWTQPSTASLFSGQYVSQHRVILGTEPPDDPQAPQVWSQVLSDEIVTLAERFREADTRPSR